jgi:hypothetical protein
MLLKPLHPPYSPLWLAEAGKLRIIAPNQFNNYLRKERMNIGTRGLEKLGFTGYVEYDEFLKDRELKAAGIALIRACHAFASNEESEPDKL